VPIPTIGIGAGPDCDGQVLVFHDALGLYDRMRPRFVKQFGNLGEQAVAALTGYAEAVRNSDFPGAEHSFSMASEAQAAFEALLAPETGRPGAGGKDGQNA
jgi:3-methyl-2-oxobutanoate hydroxymethyltransferase